MSIKVTSKFHVSSFKIQFRTKKNKSESKPKMLNSKVLFLFFGLIALAIASIDISLTFYFGVNLSTI